MQDLLFHWMHTVLRKADEGEVPDSLLNRVQAIVSTRQVGVFSPLIAEVVAFRKEHQRLPLPREFVSDESRCALREEKQLNWQLTNTDRGGLFKAALEFRESSEGGELPDWVSIGREWQKEYENAKEARRAERFVEKRRACDDFIRCNGVESLLRRSEASRKGAEHDAEVDRWVKLLRRDRKCLAEDSWSDVIIAMLTRVKIV